MRRKTHFRLFLVLLCLVFVMVCTIGCVETQYKGRIFQLVKNQKQLFLEDIAQKDYADSLSLDMVQEVYSLDGCVSFYCGGVGPAPSANVFGFYYTENDQPLGVWENILFCQSNELTPQDNGYTATYHNNSYYTEKICDHFYYYRLIY